MRGSSVHFKRIASAVHAVSHASREVPPEYLLPEGMSLGTHVVIDDAGQVQKLLEHKMNLASRQAKATPDYSPMWEGVINLPTPSANVTPAHQVEIVKRWCDEYEKMTGHKVLRADVHLDEGYVDATGHPQYNAHAHVMCDRTDDKGRVKKLTSTVLREVQNMTAEVTTLQRGLDARQTGRKHIGHQHFRFDAEKNRVQLDEEKTKAKTEIGIVKTRSLEWSNKDAAKLKAVQKVADQVPQLEAQLAQLKEQYRLDREAMKASGEAKQADYQRLKKTYEDMLQKAVLIERERNELKEKVTEMTTENQSLKDDMEATKAKFAAMANAYQADKAAGTPAHLIMPSPAPKATKTAIEAPKPQTHTNTPPKPEKSLRELLEASLRVVLDWIKSKGGEFDPVDQFDAAKSDHFGPVVEVSGMHAVQKTGRVKYTVHELAKLDKVPVLDDPKTEIHYRNGVGQVKGKVMGHEPEPDNGPGW